MGGTSLFTHHFGRRREHVNQESKLVTWILGVIRNSDRHIYRVFKVWYSLKDAKDQ
jgi:hypothetical protein